LQTEQRAKEAINAALELFHRRWTLRILWELSHADALNFRALQMACGDLSASVLNVRLAELRRALLVEHDVGRGYSLAKQGRLLLRAIDPLLRWAPRWAADVEALDNSAPGGPTREPAERGTRRG
jgi:DNA-binding HxlR family transcriptional regulator